jgi:hypothetical protein
MPTKSIAWRPLLLLVFIDFCIIITLLSYQMLQNLGREGNETRKSSHIQDSKTCNFRQMGQILLSNYMFWSILFLVLRGN